MHMAIRATRNESGIVRLASGNAEPWKPLRVQASHVELVEPLVGLGSWTALYQATIDGYPYLYAVTDAKAKAHGPL